MNKLLLGVAFLGLTIVSCQNPSKNTIEAGGAPEVCPMTGGTCEMDKDACEDMDACPMGEECDMEGMEAGCDMEGMEAKSDCCSGKE